MLSKSESNDSQRSTHPDLEESKAKRSSQSDDLSENPTKTEIASISPTRLAWSSDSNNKIRITELESKQEVTNFNGVKLNKVNENSRCWTHVKEIANTGLLVSVHHCWSTSANLEVFDVSRKGQPKKIYSFDEVSGVTGYGDVTYNPRRSLLAAIPVGGKITYYLYNFTSGKTCNIGKLIRKVKWQSHFRKTYFGNPITSLDFNPNGETIATLDYNGTCLISYVNFDYGFHLSRLVRTTNNDYWGRCRWSPNADEPLLFVKYDWSKLTIVDVERQDLILNSPVQIESKNKTIWIDVCQSNGNLLASGGSDRNVKIFDKRNARVVQTFDGIHTNHINCVRWSPSGDMLASASDDKTVALLDFRTGKKLYTGETSDDEGAAMSVCFV